MAFNPLHPRFIQSSVPRSMANASNGAPNPTIDEASSIQIVKESIRLVTGDSIIKASLKGPEAIRLLMSNVLGVPRGARLYTAGYAKQSFLHSAVSAF